MPSLDFQDIARQDGALSRLTAAARELMALDAAFKKLLPELLRANCRAVRIRDDELVVFADSGIVAARLKMIVPGLLPDLAKQGYIAGHARIKVDVRLPKQAKPKTLAISEHALDLMESAAAESVQNPVVRAALARLIKHQRG